jgi:hypothetical protein
MTNFTQKRDSDVRLTSFSKGLSCPKLCPYILKSCPIITKYIVRECIQKFSDWLPGAMTANGTAL